jgi:hypothetical protein
VDTHETNAKYLNWIYYHSYEVEAPASYAGLSTIDLPALQQSRIKYNTKARGGAMHEYGRQKRPQAAANGSTEKRYLILAEPTKIQQAQECQEETAISHCYPQLGYQYHRERPQSDG